MLHSRTAAVRINMESPHKEKKTICLPKNPAGQPLNISPNDPKPTHHRDTCTLLFTAAQELSYGTKQRGAVGGQCGLPTQCGAFGHKE